MQFHLARWAAAVVRASTKAAAMAALRTGSAEHGIYMAVGITVLAVFSLGYLVGLAMTLARLSRDNNRTDINYIERYGWVSHRGLVSRAALSGAADFQPGLKARLAQQPTSVLPSVASMHSDVDFVPAFVPAYMRV